MRTRSRDVERRWWQAIPTTSGPTITGGTVLLNEMSLPIDVRGPVLVSFSGTFSHSTIGGFVDTQLWVNGARADSLVGEAIRTALTAAAANQVTTVSFAHVLPLTPGLHLIQVYWATGGATATNSGLRRTLTVMEL